MEKIHSAVWGFHSKLGGLPGQCREQFLKICGEKMEDDEHNPQARMISRD